MPDDADPRSSGWGRPLLWAVVALLLYVLSWAPVQCWLINHDYGWVMQGDDGVSNEVPPHWAMMLYWPLNKLRNHGPYWLQMQMSGYAEWWEWSMGWRNTWGLFFPD